MEKETYKRYICLISYAFLLLFILLNLHGIMGFLGNLLKILTPLWIGIALAFTLNVPMSLIEKHLFENKVDKKVRIISLILSIMIIIFILTILFVWVIPDFIDSITYLVGQIPSLINSLNDFLVKTFENTELSEYLKDFSGNSEVTSVLSDIFKSIINNFTGFLSNFVTFIINLVTGIIIAVYFLLEKEHILGELKRVLEKILNKKQVEKLKTVYKLSVKSFQDFIQYQCLECLILGLLMFIAFVIFRFPYALTIAFLTAVTAIVPIFGATIACVIGAVLIGTTSIEQAIIFLIVFQVIQQIEGNVIYPKVVGKHVGLPPIVTIIAIIVGGKIAGFFGMLICIPITSIIYSLFWTWMNDNETKLKPKKKNLKTSS